MQPKFVLNILIIVALVSCNNTEQKTSNVPAQLSTNNLLTDLSGTNSADLKWMNKPKSFTIENGTLKVEAEKGTDFFNNPEDNTITASAPLLFKQIEGDFVAVALVRPDFSSMWNAVALMVYIDKNNWIKFAFENSDATGQSIVSVVTKTVSDDANGVILRNQDHVWLKLIRRDSIYSMLWSLDGKDYKMARLSTMPAIDAVKIGIEVQCPVGQSAIHEVNYFGIEKKRIKDLRKGI